MNELTKKDIYGSGVVTNTLGYDVYAEILASTISTLRTPANVGVFAGWGSGKSYLLNKIKVILYERSRRFSTAKGKPLICLLMLIRLIFFRPPLAIRNRNEVRFISAYFNALEYEGSDNLWAGLVTKLVGSVEYGIGRLPSAIFRARPAYFLCKDVYTKDEKKMKFRPKTIFGSKFPLYALALIVLPVCLSGGIVLLVYALNKQAFLMESSNNSTLNITTSSPPLGDNTQKSSLALGSVILCIPVVGFLKNFVPVLLKVIKTQQAKIAKIVSKPDFSKELGVMAKIKGEIKHVTRLVRYMELFEGRRIVVTIFIDDLDKLPQARIAPLLQAIKILLSDPQSRFVSIIAMDPYCVSDALETGIQSQFPAINISGHRFLKHLIQVPFCIPEMNVAEKRHLLGTLVERDRLSKSEVTINIVVEDTTDGKDKKFEGMRTDGVNESTTSSRDLKEPLLPDSVNGGDEVIPLAELHSDDFKQPLEKIEDVITACDRVMAELRNPKIFPFIKNNLQEMLRLIGIVKVTTRVIFARFQRDKSGSRASGICDGVAPVGLLPLHLAAWVVLVAQWPYRTTWLAQQVDDMKDEQKSYPSTATLAEVYRDAEKYFTFVRAWKKLIKLDDDPDTLEHFLQIHEDWLNVEFLTKLLPYTISLDSSLKSIVAWTSVERDVRHQSHLPNKRLATMDVEDVIKMINTTCVNSVHLEEYKRKCIDNNISGPVLLRGDIEEIRKCLDMALGDWIQFSHAIMQIRTHHKFNSDF